MSALANLQKANSLEDFARIIGYSPAGLAFVLYKIPEAKKYSTFDIPKKSGGMRAIAAPMPHLKLAQKHLANLLYICRDEIDQKTERRPLSHGFRRRQSIVTNAQEHKSKRNVFNVDLVNFFPSFNFGRVRGYFIGNKNWCLNEKVSTIIAQIACYNNELPQGSPSSPIIADMIAEILDVRLVRLAKRYGCKYSRYADDITFSSNRLSFPSAIAVVDPTDFTKWHPGIRLLKMVEDAGFKIHPTKTRMKHCTVRQTVTGLVVNEKVNVRTEYYRYARAMCKALFSTGMYELPASWVLAADDKELTKIRREKATKPRLEGILNHINYVKNAVDRRSFKKKIFEPSAASKLYRDFLIFRQFIGLERPMLICEGKTDSVYLQSAMVSLRKLVNPTSEGSKTGSSAMVSFFNYKSSSCDLLRLNGGAGNLSYFTKKDRFERDCARISPLRPSHPVIVVVDNDSGASELFKQLKTEFGLAIGFSTTDDFYYVCRNLYFVKTEDSSGAQSKIEDYFDEGILGTKLNGKSFNPENAIDNKTEYGKARFAEHVVRPNVSTIDFGKFGSLLDRIAAAIADYRSR